MRAVLRLQITGAIGLVALGLGMAIWWFVQRAGDPIPVADWGLGSEQLASSNPFLRQQVPVRGWPFIRGPTYDGHSEEVGLAEAWPQSGPPVLWTRPLGQGYSAFVVVNNQAFTQYQTLAGQFVACLDAETGATIWDYRYDWPYEAAGVYPGPRATPTIADGRVYFAAPSGTVGCLTSQGQLVWSVDLRERFQAKGFEFGYSCAPVVHAGRVLLPVGGVGASMVALDAKDGTTVWKSGEDDGSYTPALPVNVAGKSQVIGYLENALAGFDFETGRQLWRRELSQGYDEHAAWPIYVEPYLWISAPFRSGSQLLKLSDGDHAPVEPVWTSRLLSNDVMSSVFHEGFLYGFDLKDVQAKTHRASRGTFRCLELLSGKEQWASDTIGHASVLVADGKLILLNDQGELILARASPESFTELARVSVLGGEISWTPPALDRGRLFVRNHTRAACLYVGEESHSQNRSAQHLTVADIPQGKYADLASILGVEPEYAFDVPSSKWFQTWFATGGLLLLASGLATGALALAVRALTGRWISPTVGWTAFWLTGFVAGAVATTPLSIARGEFVFTWPVSLFVAFEAAVHQIRIGRREKESRLAGWRARGVAVIFLAVCVAYFLLCRRLSLVFEWAFLFGFAAAVPFELVAIWLAQRGRWSIIWRTAGTAVAFAAFFWSSVTLLWWKYPG